jgi:hypothetical protein
LKRFLVQKIEEFLTFNQAFIFMKSLIIFVIVLLVFLFSNAAQAQQKVTEDTLIVKGVCGMCKARIEEAAYGKGVKYATWNQETDELSVAFRADKTSLQEIEDRVAKTGHSTVGKAAEQADYDQLPACCRYEELHKH